MKNRRIVRAAVLGAALGLGASGGTALAQGPATPGPGLAGTRPDAPNAGRPRTLDDALLEVEAAAPGFGGMYYDDKGRLVLRLTHAPAAPAAERAIAAVFGREKLPAAGVVTEPAAWSFRQLKALQERVTPEVLSLAGVVLTDVDERSNRVAIGVENAEARSRVERVLARLGVTRAAIDIVEVSAVIPNNIQGGWRPLAGGPQLETPGKYCTLGFSAYQGGTPGFVTNSHCTQTQGGVEYTPAYQSVQPDYVGTEVTDPFYASGGSCPAGRICRYSDSAFFQASTSINYYVAQTPGPFNLTVSSWLLATGAVQYPSQGQTVYKTGRSSGTTSGTIQWACATINSGGTPHTYYCNYIATSPAQNAAAGDSGSPVYFISGNTATLTGLMWGSGWNPWHFAFAPLGTVQYELGVTPYTYP
jgi:hypothetical protein